MDDEAEEPSRTGELEYVVTEPGVLIVLAVIAALGWSTLPAMTTGAAG
ncbi:hypothetical protein [Dactylosporangium salmoneum]